jgi:hypothetical protein
MDFILDKTVAAAVGVLIGFLVSWIRKLITQNNSLREGLVGLLRQSLTSDYNRYHDTQGWMPLYAKDSMDAAYDSYHNLGGNGLGTEMHEKMLALPTQAKDAIRQTD